DAVARADAVDRELARLEALAKERGYALASASALPVTLERVARWAKELEGKGILLVPASTAFEARR
ncbi:MAG TPA: divergent polysaccharide deacetylase family protein, partial [Beijerinckiaceae bacterium]|nr:divergent polysaccharide deacetylase family protein [Beijerinckiaceae bacterium]